MFQSIGLLFISNIFMTIAWYGHLKRHQSSDLWKVILVSWGIAFVEYCFQVPGNRIGTKYYTVGQLKIIQEVIAMTIFSVFSICYLKTPLSKNYLYACICLVLAVYFVFKDKVSSWP